MNKGCDGETPVGTTAEFLGERNRRQRTQTDASILLWHPEPIEADRSHLLEQVIWDAALCLPLISPAKHSILDESTRLTPDCREIFGLVDVLHVTFHRLSPTVTVMKSVTTGIAMVGSEIATAANDVARTSSNVGWVTPADESEDLTIWAPAQTAAWDLVARRASIYALFGADPFAPLVREWSRRLEGRPSDLELAIGLVSDVIVPDFYLVEPAMATPDSHWYLDHLTSLAPSRVIVTAPNARAVRAAIGSLPYGPSLPAARELAASARSYVPQLALTVSRSIRDGSAAATSVVVSTL